MQLGGARVELGKVDRWKELAALGPELVRKYSVSGPRYTSYPTAVEFSNEFGPGDWEGELRREFRRGGDDPERPSRAISLYLHIPFCFRPCYFCACHKVIPRDRSVVRPYLDAIYGEMEKYAELLPSACEVEQIHWGGGSPEYLEPQEMEELFNRTLGYFPNLLKGADVSVELDPRKTSDDHLRTLRRLGFSRISIGVQDFDADVQRIVNRVQPFEVTKAVFDTARSLDFLGINLDLIYGLPAQTLSTFSYTLDRVSELRPDRIALYGYAHVTWLKKTQKILEKTHLPSPEERVELFLMATERLIRAGYRYIGMDHFALPKDELSTAFDDGRLNRNFMGYTTHRGARVLGFGVSSISSIPAAYAQNTKDIDFYESESGCGALPIYRGLRRSEEDRLRAEIIEAILCRASVDIPEIEREWKVDFSRKFREELAALKPLEDDGLVECGEDFLRITPLGRLFLRNIAMVFDEYLERHRKEGKSVFSQAV